MQFSYWVLKNKNESNNNKNKIWEEELQLESNENGSCHSKNQSIHISDAFAEYPWHNSSTRYQRMSIFPITSGKKQITTRDKCSSLSRIAWLLTSDYLNSSLKTRLKLSSKAKGGNLEGFVAGDRGVNLMQRKAGFVFLIGGYPVRQKSDTSDQSRQWLTGKGLDCVRKGVGEIVQRIVANMLGLSGSNSYVREHDSQNRSNVTQHTSHCNCRPLTSEQNVTSGETYLQLGCLRCSDVKCRACATEF
uniref:Uncharacterized protein n=1 Tax=Glossina pallidipes TaxID=7398 RepID=A0A1A9ZKQ3_GLOPL